MSVEDIFPNDGNAGIEIQNPSKNVFLVVLHRKHSLSDEFTAVNEIIAKHPSYHVIVDFIHIEIITSKVISKLLELRKLMSECKHRLILCNVSFATKCIFTVVGLKSKFEFADDKFAALAALEQTD